MTVAHVFTVAFAGIEARTVDVQVHMAESGAREQIAIVGLPDKAVAESRERVRAALHAVGLALPLKRITVNLSPADLPKEGSHYDLPIALGLLGDPKAIPLLRKSLDNRRTQWHQAYAATALAMLGDRPSTISIRERFVECRDPDVRQHLAVALGLLGDESAGDDLARLLGRSRSYQDRGAAAMAIGLLRLASKVPLLVATIHDKSEHVTVRACAVSALAQIADPYPVPRLARIVADDDYALGIEPVDRAWALLNRR